MLLMQLFHTRILGQFVQAIKVPSLKAFELFALLVSCTDKSLRVTAEQADLLFSGTKIPVIAMVRHATSPSVVVVAR
ncbi:hypothetical protein D3C81_2196960 [compost metagenome]